MEMKALKKTMPLLMVASLFLGGAAWAGSEGGTKLVGDVANGLKVYNKRCVWCHGVEGDGAGPAQDLINPPPRDFTSGNYKIKTTGFEDMVPNDEDIYRMIRDGMPGTDMPGWESLLSEQEMWDLVAQVKVFSEYQEEKPETQIDYGTPVVSSAESISKGQKLFVDRCAECHGDLGKGDAVKKLKGDAEERTWPRNLSKPWTYLGSNSAKDIYARITTGIPGTQMPSFADPISKKKLSVEERWHVANFVQTLVTEQKVRAENTVIKAEQVEGALPATPDDEKWQTLPPTTFYLIPQMIAKERYFTPSNDTMTVRAAFNDKDIVLLLEWDDRTKSIPGDETAKSIAEDELTEDAVAVQLPVKVPEGMEKPYFGMGDASHPVNIWQWKSGSKDAPESVHLMNAMGFGQIEPRDVEAGLVTATGTYHKGTWKVVMKRPLLTSDAENDLQFQEGQFIPIAFAAWDGSNGESGSKHTMTTWYWILIKPASSSKPLLIALLVMALLGLGQYGWVRSAAKKRES